MADKPMSVSTVFSRAFSTWFDHFPLLLIPAFLLAVPPLALELMLASVPANEAGTNLIVISSGLLLVVASLLLTGFAAPSILRSLQPGSFRRTSRGNSGLSQLLSLVFASIAVPVVAAIGLLACVIPGIYLWLVLVAVVPVIAIENTGITEAFRRSAELTDGHRSTIFLLLVLYGILHLLVAGCFGGVMATVINEFVPNFTVATAGQEDAIPLGTLLAPYVTDVLMLPLQVTLTVVIYCDLRRLENKSSSD